MAYRAGLRRLCIGLVPLGRGSFWGRFMREERGSHAEGGAPEEFLGFAGPIDLRRGWSAGRLAQRVSLARAVVADHGERLARHPRADRARSREKGER